MHFKSYPLTPALSPKGGEGEREPIFVVFKNSVRLRERELICAVSKPEFDAMLQVGVTRKNNSVSPLSLKGGEGEREPIFVVFKNSVRLRERELICAVSKPEFDAMLQVGVTRKNNSVSPLSLWERARVRGFSGHAFDVKFRARKSVVIYRLRL
ncbi:hypothetical protein [Pseudomonas fluorescens]|uniref:hypothetical protein n=1 Tax=Pseudomonas fluorescens TaxID=294 RepID=UPI00177CAAD1|nr:hypothetical protein [Pseudomonas fluorescens]